MSQQILSECLDIFEKKYFPHVLPDPKYCNQFVQQSERFKMIETGKRFDSRRCSDLAVACLSGNYIQFIYQFNRSKIQNLNTYFETESKLSLLHFVMHGRKVLILRPHIKDHNLPYQHFKIAKYLLDHDLFVDIQNKWGYSCLHESVINCQDLEFAKFLLTRGANPNLKTIFGDSPLHSAVSATSIEALKLLCEYGADPRIPEEFSDITPIYISKTHIESYTILSNAKRKLECNINTLQHEDVSYCVVCNISSKVKKLFQCSRCKGAERYCGHKCQKRYWLKHKKQCKINRNKIIVNDTEKKVKELVFTVSSAHDQGLIPVAPIWTQHAENVAETVNKHFTINNYGIEKHRKKYQKKRRKRFNREIEKSLKMVANKSRVNEKFVIKIQSSDSSILKDTLLVYDKKRKYRVTIYKKNQRKKWMQLKKLLDKYGIGPQIYGSTAKKAYFYGWIDRGQKLHVMIDNVLALQPW
eukprot:509048_1